MNLRSYLRGAGIGILITAIVLSFGGGSRTKAMSDSEVMERARELGKSGGNETLTEAYTVATAPEIEALAEPVKEASGKESVSGSEPVKEASGKESVSGSEPVKEASGKESVSGSEPVKEASGKESVSGSEPVTEASGKESVSEAEAVKEPGEKSAENVIEEGIRDNQTTALKSDLTGEDKTKSELLADAAETEAGDQSPVTETDSGFISIHVNAGSSSSAVARELEKAGAVSSASRFDGFLCANGYDRRLSTGDFRIPRGASDDEIARILMRR